MTEPAAVDFHQHLWPEAFVAALARRREPPCLEGETLVLAEGRFAASDLGEHALGPRLAALDRMGVERAVVSLQPTLGVDELPDKERDALHDVWLEGTRELVDAARGRLLALAPGAALDGFAGASVAASALLDLEPLAPLLDELERRGGVLFVHPGVSRPATGTPAWWAGVVDYPAQMQQAYFAWLDRGDRWASLRVVFAILAGGAPFQLERLAPRGVDVRSTLDANVFLDTATYGRRAIELCIETFGVHQLVYGSDTPVVDPTPTLDAVRGFGDSVHKIVTTDNPERLLA
jgi:hypothetical protein